MKKVISICLLAGLVLAGCTSTVTVKQVINTLEPAASAEAKQSDSATFELSDGSQIKLNINAVTETEERIAGETKVYDNVIKIDYGYENISSSNDLKIDSSNFKVYDQFNQAAKVYDLSSAKKAESIKKGSALLNAYLYYAINSASGYVTIEFRYNASAKDADATFVLQVQ